VAQAEVTKNEEGIATLLSVGAAAFSTQDIGVLRTTGTKLSSLAYLHTDENMVLTSAVFYSLAKFLEKQYIQRDPKWAAYQQDAKKLLAEAVEQASKGQQDKLTVTLQSLLSECDEVSELLGRFHVSTTEKARVKIAADFYARGASLGSAAALAGADKSSVLSYIGVTRITDKYETIPVATRLKSAEQLFKQMA
jgi:hypothetical protein